MADVRAFRSGMWSDTTATSPWWNGSAIYAPTFGDNVWTNTYTLYVDVDVDLGNIGTISNNSATSRVWKDGGTATATVGGRCYLNNNISLTANSVNNTSAATIELTGSNNAFCFGKGSAGQGGAFKNSGTGTLTIQCSGFNASTGWGSVIYNTSTGIVNLIVYPNITLLNIGGPESITNSSTGTVNITATKILGGGPATATTGSNTPTVYNTAGGKINILGDVYAGTSYGVQCGSYGSGVISISGNVYASTFCPAVWHRRMTGGIAGGYVKVVGSIYNCPYTGIVAVLTNKLITGNPPAAGTSWQICRTPDGTSDKFFSETTSGFTHALSGDVRYGTVYSGLTGSCNIPPTNRVASGVRVDNTTGTATLSSIDISSTTFTQLSTYFL